MESHKKLFRACRALIESPKNILSKKFCIPLYPELIVFEITDACNSKCIHCNIWKKKPTLNMLTREEIRTALSDPLFKKVKTILITGGEPILRGDLKEILLDMKNILPKSSLWLSTNGLLPNKVLDLVRFSKEKKINIGVGVSLDAVGKNHDKSRGIPGNFDKVDFLLEELVKIRNNYKELPITIGFTLSKYTAKDYKKLEEYAKNLKVEFLVQTYNEAKFYNNINDSSKDCLGNNTELIKVINSLPPSMLKEFSIKSLKGESMKFSCFSLHKFFLLRPNGDIAPCLNWCNVVIGNVRQSSPSEIWNSGKAREIRKRIKKCSGCLNDWCTKESFKALYYPGILDQLKNKISK